MSRANEQWVWDHSPYSGGMLLLHLAMGDLANHDNGDELWAGDEYLAVKSRISVGSVRRHRAKMVEDGYLEVVEAGGGRGKRHCVRLLKPAQTAHVLAEAEPARRAPETRADAAANSRRRSGGPLVNPSQPKEQNPPAAKATEDPMTACAHRLTVVAFEQPIKPTLARSNGNAFAAVLAMIRSQLVAGHSDQAIRAAIERGVEVWTLAGLQTAIAHANPRARQRAPRDGDGRTLGELLTTAQANEQRGRT